MVERLTVGSAVGSIRELFAKIQSIDAKHGKFDFVLCLGDFFGPPKDATEEYGEDSEVIQLLEGKLEGRIRSMLSYVSKLNIRAYSPHGMLHHARRTSPPSPCY